MFPNKFNFSGQMLFEKFLKGFLYIILGKKISPECDPSLSPGTMISINLNLYYLRILPHNVQLFLPNGF